jgi:hypothetical protein
MVLGKVVAEEARLVGCRQQLQAVLIELAQRLSAAVDPVEHAKAHFAHRHASFADSREISRYPDDISTRWVT